MGPPRALRVPVANQTLGGEQLTAKITGMNAGPCRFYLVAGEANDAPGRSTNRAKEQSCRAIEPPFP